MRWLRLIDFWTPQVFSPKVTPDPTSAARLDEKFAVVIDQLKRGQQSSRAAKAAAPL